jgi:hypothetical protein
MKKRFKFSLSIEVDIPTPGLDCGPYRLSLCSILGFDNPQDVNATSLREAYQQKYGEAYPYPLKTTADWRKAVLHCPALHAAT